MDRPTFLRTASASAVMLAIVMGTSSSVGGSSSALRTWRPYLGSAFQARLSSRPPRTSARREAERLQRRIARRTSFGYTLDVLEKAVRERRGLLVRSIDIEYKGDDGVLFKPARVDLAASAHLVQPSFTFTSLAFAIDLQQLSMLIESQPPPDMRPSLHTRLVALQKVDGVLRATADAVARPGYDIDEAEASRLIAKGLSDRAVSVTVPVHPLAGHVFNETGRDLGKLELLASGVSNFEGSGDGRKANVRKGISERVHNVVVPPGELFSFNSTLDRITERNGWELAYAIFGGGTLVPVPGGGLCQVATTVYRAALNAGLPIVERANHSLFVQYYASGGIGKDATIYPGSQDLVFRNDTGNFILIQAYTDGDDATVNFYGTPDGRSVAFRGPFFAPSAPPELGRTLRSNEVAWVRTVRDAAGQERAELIHSRYKTIPQSVVRKYAPKLAASVQTVQ